MTTEEIEKQIFQEDEIQLALNYHDNCDSDTESHFMQLMDEHSAEYPEEILTAIIKQLLARVRELEKENDDEKYYQLCLLVLEYAESGTIESRKKMVRAAFDKWGDEQIEQAVK